MQHRSLENGRWAELSFPQQMANIGSETSRVLKALEAGKESRAQSAFTRFQELMDLTIRYGRLQERNLPELAACAASFWEWVTKETLQKKTATELLLLRFLSDSHRTHYIQPLAISKFYIIFVYQSLTLVNPISDCIEILLHCKLVVKFWQSLTTCKKGLVYGENNVFPLHKEGAS